LGTLGKYSKLNIKKINEGKASKERDELNEIIIDYL